MFEPFEGSPSLPEEEQKILDFWDKHQTFYKSCDQRIGQQEFVFYDGPPFATGLPHHGHLLVSTIKDIVARYATMKGAHVRRRFGWDCHGLPVEYEIEKKLEISGKKEIEDFGVASFNQECQGIVDRYSNEWRQTIARLGRWVDFNDEYRTMDTEYMESVWWVFKELWEKQLIYQGHRSQPYCPRCCTPLSNFETNQGYRDRQDPSVTITCPQEGGELVFLVWTTTPWTLPSNVALCVGPDISYDFVKKGNSTYVIASSRRLTYFSEEDEVLKTVKGHELKGIAYSPLFDYFKEKATEKTFTVTVDDYVSDVDGTGIVHLAPAFGEDDHRIGVRENLPFFDPFNDEIIFQEPVSDFKGLRAKEADRPILRELKKRERLFHESTLEHSYPHCWRCDSPLIYRALKAWFMKIDPIKDSMIRNNQTIHWVPEHLKDGRFGKWLDNARDWNLSRNRYWGSPIPVWLCPQGHSRCVGSRFELEELSGKTLSDLHKHFVDDVTFPCPECQQDMRRTPEVLDCWFESGAMPYAQIHYPFQNKDYFERTFPADFITEAMDQTRGWFYSLTVLAAALFDKPAFKNIVVCGLLLAEDGKKMSKSKRNFTPPETLMDKYGADAFRLALINSPVVRGEPVRFGDEVVQESLRSILIPLVNSVQFFLTYAKADGWYSEPWLQGDVQQISSVELDRWTLSRLQSLLKEINSEMTDYQLNRMVPPLLAFLDELTNWYIRRSRRRFWKSENDQDKEQAYQTLHFCLTNFLKALAPLIPFTTEVLYQKLVAAQDESQKSSIHLCDYPGADEALIDLDLERRMAAARQAVTLGHALRKEHKIRVRQPLPQLTLVARTKEDRQDFSLMEDLILEELNVKQIVYTEDDKSLVTISTRPNFKTLGRRLGSKLKTIGPQLKNLTEEDIEALESGRTVTVENETFSLNDILIDRTPREGVVVGSENGVTVALDTNLSTDLIQEGRAREIVNRLQAVRKEKGLDVSDRIHLKLNLPEELKEAFTAHKSLILSEVLATESALSDDSFASQFEIDEFLASCHLEKISS